MPRPSHRPCFHHPNNIWVRSTKYKAPHYVFFSSLLLLPPPICPALDQPVTVPHTTINDLRVTGYKAALGAAASSHHGPGSAAGASGAGGAVGTGRALAQLVHSAHQQAKAGRVHAFRQGSLPLDLPYRQPR